MWIKICGITQLEDARFAVHAGADAVGFVFAESPRRMKPEAVREITKELPSSVEKIGVFVDASADEIADTCEIAGLTGVQLHGKSVADQGASHVSDVRARLKKNSAPRRVIEVVRYDGDNDRFALELRNFSGDSAMDPVLVDTCVAGKQGGTGQVFDWLSARDSFLREASHLRLIAAGGLCPENVRHVLQILNPWGVDVSSGVESSPGRKDHRRVAEFIREARRVEDD